MGDSEEGRASAASLGMAAAVAAELVPSVTLAAPLVAAAAALGLRSFILLSTMAPNMCDTKGRARGTTEAAHEARPAVDLTVFWLTMPLLMMSSKAVLSWLRSFIYVLRLRAIKLQDVRRGA